MVRRLSTALLLAAALAGAGCSRPDAVAEARSLVRQHRTSDAVRRLRARLSEEPRDIDARALLVRVLAFDGDLESARREVELLARALPPSDPRPWLELGHALELAHRFDEALAAYDEASSRAPRSPAGPRVGGLRAARWGEAEDARARLEEARRRGAHDRELLHALAMACAKLGDYDAARAAYLAALREDPRAAEAHLGLATVALARHDYREAARAYGELVRARPGSSSAWLGKAYAELRSGQLDRAERSLREAEEHGASAAHVARQREALAVARRSRGASE